MTEPRFRFIVRLKMSSLRAVALVAALALSGIAAGCSNLDTVAPAPQATSGPAKGAATLDIPFGDPCGAELTAYKSVMDNDLQVGHVNKSVYDKVIGELKQAVAACKGGHSYEAIALMNATKRKYGYPVPQGTGPIRRDLAN